MRPEPLSLTEALLAGAVLAFLIWAVPHALAELTGGALDLVLAALRDLIDGPGQ